VRVRIPADICLTVPDGDEAATRALLAPLLLELECHGWDRFVPQSQGEGLPPGCELVVVWRACDDRAAVVIDGD